MAETSELIEFRRAFVWLLCGMLLPSVALVAFGVVAVANERAAVERRLTEEYDARLHTLALDLLARLDKAAGASQAGTASR
jgi:two-component system phosphate regulon sensor histidine kinase PhoR